MASRFWVGGTGTWDSSDTTHWSATTGGSSGASVPGSSDTASFDANSGGGTCTVNTTVALQQLSLNNYTGTLDFSANNNNVTLSGSVGLSFQDSLGTHTLNMGNGTWTMTNAPSSGTATVWNASNANLTLNANGSTLDFSANTLTGTGARQPSFGNKTYNNVSMAPGCYASNSAAICTIGTLTLSAGVSLVIASGFAINLTTPVFNGTAALPVSIGVNATSGTCTIGGDGTYTLQNVILKNVTFSGSNPRSATNSFDMGGNSGITITQPSSGRVTLVNSSSLVG